MAGEHECSTFLQGCIDRLRAGDEDARTELLTSACSRLERLTRKMLKDDPRVGRWEQAEDVCQNALLRLHRSLKAVQPPTVRDFFRLATAQIRRELYPSRPCMRHSLAAGKRLSSTTKVASFRPGVSRMARIPINLSETEQAIVASERYAHPDLHVRRKMLVLWSVHAGLTRLQAGQVASVGRATVQRYLAAYRAGGLDGLRRWGSVGPVRELASHVHSDSHSA